MARGTTLCPVPFVIVLGAQTQILSVKIQIASTWTITMRWDGGLSKSVVLQATKVLF